MILEFNERHQIGQLTYATLPPLHMDLQKFLNMGLGID